MHIIKKYWHIALLLALNSALIFSFFRTTPINEAQLGRLNQDASTLRQNWSLMDQSIQLEIEELENKVEERNRMPEEVQVVDSAKAVRRYFSEKYQEIEEALLWIDQNGANEESSKMVEQLINNISADLNNKIINLKLPSWVVSEDRELIISGFYDLYYQDELKSKSVMLLRLILISYRTYLSNVEERVTDILRDEVGASDVSFSDGITDGIMAARGSRSEIVEEKEEDFYFEVVENPFIKVVDAATDFLYPSKLDESYELLKVAVAENSFPAPANFQINELLNHFSWNPDSTKNTNISLSYFLDSCTWNPDHYLLILKVQAKTQDGQDLIAEDVNIETSFDKAFVESYRYLGQEGQILDYIDPEPCNLSAGETLVLAYELIPATTFIDLAVLGDIRINYLEHKTGIPSQISDQLIYLSESEEGVDYLFISSIIEAALVLKGSEYKGNADLKNTVIRLKGLEEHLSPEQLEFLRLLEMLGGYTDQTF